MSKSAVICYLGNPHFDTRVTNLYNSLQAEGWKVKVIGFDWRNPDFKTLKGDVTVFKLKKGKISISFYLKFVFLLLSSLMKYRADYYFAEDIYTLPFVYHIARLKKSKIVYNSRELFKHLAGLRNKKIVQSVIAKIEDKYIRKVDNVLTTGDMDTEFLEKEYNISNVITIRNLPLQQNSASPIDYVDLLGIDKNKKILFYQGVLFEGRGLGVVIKLLAKLENYVFVMCGSGEHIEKYIKMADDYGVRDRVHFMGAINQSELINYTAGADLGLSLVENISISYYYALPNKLFEYIMAGIPVLVSDLPQMRKIVDEYGVGRVVNMDNEDDVLRCIASMLSDNESLASYKERCLAAANELNWQREFVKLKSLLN